MDQGWSVKTLKELVDTRGGFERTTWAVSRVIGFSPYVNEKVKKALKPTGTSVYSLMSALQNRKKTR